MTVNTDDDVHLRETAKKKNDKIIENKYVFTN